MSDILDNAEGIIVHGCNSHGVMGSGIARQIREKFPKAYQDYKDHYDNHGLRLGEVIFSTPTNNQNLVIANAITQKNFGRSPNILYVNYDALRACFKLIANFARERELPVFYPKIGAGLANGDWNIISNIINEELSGLDHKLYLLDTKAPKF